MLSTLVYNINILAKLLYVAQVHRVPRGLQALEQKGGAALVPGSVAVAAAEEHEG